MCLHPLGDIKMDDGDSSASHDDVHAMDVNANEERVTSEDGGVEDAADTSLGPINNGADGVAFAEQKKRLRLCCEGNEDLHIKSLRSWSITNHHRAIVSLLCCLSCCELSTNTPVYSFRIIMCFCNDTSTRPCSTRYPFANEERALILI